MNTTLTPLATTILPTSSSTPKKYLLKCPQKKQTGIINNLSKMTNDELKRSIQQSCCSSPCFLERSINQIKEELNKPVEKRLHELIAFQTCSVSKAEAVQNIISMLFHEIIILSPISKIDRKSLLHFAMRDRCLGRTALNGKGNSKTITQFTINVNSLNTESLAFYFRFLDKLTNASQLTNEIVDFLIDHRDEINDDLKGFIADLITFYECNRNSQNDSCRKEQQILNNFGHALQCNPRLKELFEIVCPISTSMINRFNTRKKRDLDNFAETRTFEKITSLSFEEVDVYRPLFKLWLKSKDSHLALFKAALRVLNQEKENSNHKLQFIKTYCKDSLKLFTDNFEDYPALLAKLIPQLEAPYIMKGELEKLFESKKTEIATQVAEEKHPPKEIVPQPHIRSKDKQCKPKKPKPLIKSELEEIVPQPTDSPKLTSIRPLIKTEKFPYTYDWRVSDWFTKSPQHLSFPSYNQLSEEDQQRQSAYHSFAREVDQFVLTYGIHFPRLHEVTGDIENCYCIPGEIAFTEYPRNERGMFTYTVNKNNALYHRYFTIASPDKMIACIISKTFDQIDFPKLGVNAADFQDMPVTLPRFEAKVTINSLTDAVTIQDTYHQMRITLFKYA